MFDHESRVLNRLDQMLVSDHDLQGKLAVGVISAAALLASVIEVAGNSTEAVRNYITGKEGQA